MQIIIGKNCVSLYYDENQSYKKFIKYLQIVPFNSIKYFKILFVIYIYKLTNGHSEALIIDALIPGETSQKMNIEFYWDPSKSHFPFTTGTTNFSKFAPEKVL